MRRAGAHRGILLCIALGFAGCTDGGGFGVALSITADPLVSDQVMAMVTQLRVIASGDESSTSTLALDRSFMRDERLIYRPGQDSRNLSLAVLAEDVAGAVLATAHTEPLALDAGQLTYVAVLLAPLVKPDGGNDGMVNLGTEGDDFIVAGYGGALRNPQFERWKIASEGDIEGRVGDVTAFHFSAQLGWIIDPTPATVEGLSTGGACEHNPARSGYLFDGNSTASAYPLLGHFTLDTSWLGPAGLWIRQLAPTIAGAHYTLRVQLSDPLAGDVGTDPINQALEIRWSGVSVGSYSTVTRTWTGVSPVSAGGNRLLLSFDVVASGAKSEVAFVSFGPLSSNGVALDYVSLDPVAEDANWALVGGAGSDLLVGGRHDDTLYGGALGDSVSTPEGAANGFVYSMGRDNGADVIMDFHVGVDRIILVDVLDTYNAYGGTQRTRFDFGDWNAVAAPDASRLPGLPGDASRVTADSDFNLGYRDISRLSSHDQYVVPRASSDGSLMLQLFGPSERPLGSVTLRGVPFSSVAHTDVDVMLRRLLGGSGYVDPAIPNPAPSSQFLFLSTDGVHEGLMTSVVH